MYRVYLGNLDEQVTESILQKVFADHSLPVTSVLIKRGYGFVDCPDQTTFDQTIDRLNGLFLMLSYILSFNYIRSWVGKSFSIGTVAAYSAKYSSLVAYNILELFQY